MADFALWATACETALWPAGTFMSAYDANRDDAIESVIDADPVAAVLRTMMEARTAWTGTASDLLGALAEMAGERPARSKTWPGNARALSNRLRRAATFLRKVGIDIDFGRGGKGRTRIIHITCRGAENAPAPSAAPSASSVNAQETRERKGVASLPRRTVTPPADAKADAGHLASDPSVRGNLLKSKAADAADAADANSGLQSVPGTRGRRWTVRL